MMPGRAALLIAAIAGGVVLTPERSKAQWWGARTPADFEECADSAEQAASREQKASQLSECNAKFAGRRKPGGGYTYFDFMQNRSFDIAGPNPTPQEQKQIDEQYTAFLEQERRSSIAAAFAAKQRQLQQTAYRAETEKMTAPAVAPGKLQPTGNEPRSRSRAANCPKHTFSCDWPRISEGIRDLKKALFGPWQAKPKRS